MVDGAFGAFLNDWYLWIKALHVISVIAWMAGMFYLPRLYVYHCDAKPGSDLSETLKIMERRLLRAIINPAMIAAWLFGILLVLRPGFDYLAGWFHVKLTMLILMQITHAFYARWRKTFSVISTITRSVPARRGHSIARASLCGAIGWAWG